MATYSHDIDYNRLYALKIDIDPETRSVSIAVGAKNAPWPRLRQNLLDMVNIEGVLRKDIRREGDTKIFPPIKRDFVLRLGLEPIAAYTLETNGELTQTMKRPLTSSEVRRMGTFHHATPYPLHQKDLSLTENQTLKKTAENAVFIDCHTHSSGQISPRGLMDVARQHRVYYPLEWLHEAGVEVNFVRWPKEMRREFPRVSFPPREREGVELSPMVESIPIEALTPEEREKLERLMAMPTDRQSTYSEMENQAYYFRYPLTKNDALTKDILKQTARESSRQGFQYSAIDYVSLDKPNLLTALHQAMWEIERDPNLRDTQMRFMVGIPRTLPLPKFKESLEKAKVLLDSPYIVGIDVLGYEVNKTKEFSAALDEFCSWANEHKPGCMIRAHAGENDKNPDNVKELLLLAKKYPKLVFGVGHGVYGMDAETLALLKELNADPNHPRVIIEPNPASVLALNNIDDLKQIPFEKMVTNRIPFIVSSDGAGLYSTTPKQLGLDAMFGGLRQEGFELLAKTQRFLMQHQLEFSARQAANIPGWNTKTGREAHLQTLLTRLAKVPAPIMPKVTRPTAEMIRERLNRDQVMLLEEHDAAPELDKRKLISIQGASGESWARMTPEQQRESAIAIDMLLHVLDPDKAYIEMGRNKLSGLSAVLRNSATSAANDNHAPFYKHGHLAELRIDNEAEEYGHLTHVTRIHGGKLDIADAIVDRVFKRHGALIAVGGATFTRDIILKADQRGMLDEHPTNRKMMLLLQCASGASEEKSRMLSPQYRAKNGYQLIAKMQNQYPEVFRDDFSLNQLAELYHASEARVEAYARSQPGAIVSGTVHRLDTGVVAPLGSGRAV